MDDFVVAEGRDAGALSLLDHIFVGEVERVERSSLELSDTAEIAPDEPTNLGIVLGLRVTRSLVGDLKVGSVAWLNVLEADARVHPVGSRLLVAAAPTQQGDLAWIRAEEPVVLDSTFHREAFRWIVDGADRIESIYPPSCGDTQIPGWKNGMSVDEVAAWLDEPEHREWAERLK